MDQPCKTSTADDTPYPVNGTREQIERWWLDHAHAWLDAGYLKAAEVALSSAAADLRVRDAFADLDAA